MGQTNARLASAVFPLEAERTFFSEWCDMAGGVEVQFVPRAVYISRGGANLVALTDSWGNPKKSLLLPDDVQHGEIAEIVLLVQKATFGSRIPDHAVVWQVIDTLERETTSLLRKSRCKNLLRGLKNVGTVPERLPALPGDALDARLKLALYEAFLQLGMRDLARGMLSFTRKDFEAMSEVDRKDYADLKYGLDEVGIPIRDKIGLESLKAELNEARRGRNRDAIARVERKTLGALIEELKSFPWQRAIYGPDSFSPTGVLHSKKTLCLGKTYLLTSLLQELGIRQEAATLPRHIASKVILADDSELLVDPTVGESCKLPTSSRKVGAYFHLPDLELNQAYLVSNIVPILRFQDADTAFVTEMLVSWGYDEYLEWGFTKGTIQNAADHEHLERAERCFRQALQIIPDHGAAWQGLGKTLEALGDGRQALQAYAQALRCNPLDDRSSSRMVALFQERGETAKGEEEGKRLQMARERWSAIVPAPQL